MTFDFIRSGKCCIGSECGIKDHRQTLAQIIAVKHRYLPHVNVPANRQQLVKQFLSKTRITVLPHPIIHRISVWRLHVLINEKIFTGTPFNVIRLCECSITGCFRECCDTWFSAILPEIIRTEAEIYCCPRWLLWRWMCFASLNYSN